MMSDADKPFACGEPGCGMRFANEDHLIVHKMKHDMSLALLTPGARTAGSLLTFVDQTPTPTKFLKNCEEIGLFSDLGKNPFEEAFKKASEGISGDGKTAEGEHLTVETSESATLNTPTPNVVIRNVALNMLNSSITKSTVPKHTPNVALPPQAKKPKLDGEPAKYIPLVGEKPSPSRREPEYIPLPGPSGDTGSTLGDTPSPVTTPKSPPQKGGSTSDGSQGFTPKVACLPIKKEIMRQMSKTSATETARTTQTVVRQAPVPGAVTQPPVATVTGELGYQGTVTKLTSPKVVQKPVAMAIVAGSPSPAQSPRPAVSAPGVVATVKQPQCMLQVTVQMPNGQMVPVHIPAALPTPIAMVTHAPVKPAESPKVVMATSTVSSSTGTASETTKQKLKATIQQNVQQSILNSNLQVMTEAVDRVTSLQGATTSPGQAIRPRGVQIKSEMQTVNVVQARSVPQVQAADTSTPQKRRHSLSLEDDDDDDDEGDTDDRRKKFLERNRAAAARCRQKKKVWVGTLEKKAEELQDTNSKLQKEVSCLRNEVLQLKTLLLAHKDCPITLQQQNTGQLSIQTVSSQEVPVSSSTTGTLLRDSLQQAAVQAVVSGVGSLTGVQTVALVPQMGRQQFQPVFIRMAGGEEEDNGDSTQTS